MSEEQEEELTLDRLASGDRPSLYALGMVAAHSLQIYGSVFFAVDVLGRVQVLPPQSVKMLRGPMVEEETLDRMEEADAINTLLSQGQSEAEVGLYLQARDQRALEREGGN